MTNNQIRKFAQMESLLLVIIFFGFACMWIVSYTPVHLFLYVQSNPTIYEMSQIIQKQERVIEYMSANPKIIYRCSDDESKIKYPRYASDDLTEIVMATSDECGVPSITDAVLIVHTSADHFQRRARFRQTYSNYNNTKPYRLKVVFLVGSVLDAHLQIKLEMENREYGDTVMGVFLDTYQNLTLKAVMGLRWLSDTCHDIRLLIKMDDDVFFNVHKFFYNYWRKMPYSKRTNSIHCNLWHNAQVFRTGKWKVEKGLFANSSYNFPYCSGFFVVISSNLINTLYKHSKTIDFFWIDDVFLYGMVTEAVGGVRFYQLGAKEELVSDSYETFQKCITKGHRCRTWAVLTDGEGEFDAEYKRRFSRTSLSKQNVVKSSNNRYRHQLLVEQT